MSEARSGGDKPRRRQARGERRIAQLLDAAANVFCSVGYRAASTNAIAREAGVSPGTLYQFFPNKEAIGDALSQRLVIEMRNVHGTALSLDHSALGLRELLDRVIDPLVDFNLENPVCFALFHGPDMPQRFDEEHDLLEKAILDQVKTIFAGRAPQLERSALDRTADICWHTFKGVLQAMFEKEDEAERHALVPELKKLLYGYLEPIMGEDAPALRPQAVRGTAGRA
ncbi:TetR/AcrR family transcriptional regulator [Wenjunlia tyrosinilytica]|uniref:TetR family transcriptional regulator n=1 Tax=Wenjunlia tyrosinilytica TaxID=1544741 RepID=A0A917ZQ58_9ACTN|nr:TetR/AcrR family transcriptional regulator [Wenjunlia tyrosinilytica]GGO88721.1 TetR family transcriptional regulator [Wenjunlia tyrosinilytica]